MRSDEFLKMSISGRAMSLQPQPNSRRIKPQQSFSSIGSDINRLSTVGDIGLELFGQSVIEQEQQHHQQQHLPANVVSSKYGIHVSQKNASNKVAMQKLASSFVELNKKKAEKREREQSTWRRLIKGAIDLQKGKIPLLLAVEAGNQSMCRELLSAQTAEQLKVNRTYFSLFIFIHFIIPHRALVLLFIFIFYRVG